MIYYRTLAVLRNREKRLIQDLADARLAIKQLISIEKLEKKLDRRMDADAASGKTGLKH